MNLSSDQVSLFWQLWAQACRAQGWKDKPTQERQRKALLVRCGFKSLTTVDRTGGFTRVKNEILILVKPDLKAAQETEDKFLNQARVLRFKIERELLPCLALYVADAVAFMRTIMEEKNRWWKIDRPASEMTLDDLDARPIVTKGIYGQLEEHPSTLEQLLFTLTARLGVKRRAAGHTEHDMKVRAGVKCDCALCANRHDIVPPLATPEQATVAVNENPDWSVE